MPVQEHKCPWLYFQVVGLAGGIVLDDGVQDVAQRLAVPVVAQGVPVALLCAERRRPVR